MTPASFFDRVVVRISGNAGQTVDYDLRPGQQPLVSTSNPLTYPDTHGVTTVINQSFNEIFVHNLSADMISICIERDPGNNLPVNLSAPYGNITVGVDSTFGNRPGSIDRLRIFFNGVGTAEVILSK